jgi:hypothetical protein
VFTVTVPVNLFVVVSSWMSAPSVFVVKVEVLVIARVPLSEMFPAVAMIA